ncbi:hypothetical protein [Limosilactobacillus fermentum]|uniref:hypothetical protein n=1 Tax=Limosilactobacillus fermentum TaxID=1613 RepID=UPI003BA00094
MIVDLAKPGEAEAKQVNDLITNLANKGYRALGVAKSTDQGKSWQILGVSRCLTRQETTRRPRLTPPRLRGST